MCVCVHLEHNVMDRLIAGWHTLCMYQTYDKIISCSWSLLMIIVTCTTGVTTKLPFNTCLFCNESKLSMTYGSNSWLKIKRFAQHLTTSRWLTCIHAKLFPTVKWRTCIHVLRHYSRNSYFGRYAIFSESSGSCLGDPGQKAPQTTIEPTRFVDFSLIPLSNTCSLVRPARNVSREIFLHCQEGFCVGKFGRVVDRAVLDNRPLRKAPVTLELRLPTTMSVVRPRAVLARS